MREYQFRAPLHSDEAISVSNFCAVVIRLVAFLLSDIAPNLIHFHVFDGEVLQLRQHQSLATFRGQHKQAENRIAMDISHAFNAANAHALVVILQKEDRSENEPAHRSKKTERCSVSG
jgi:hypothetical protein